MHLIDRQLGFSAGLVTALSLIQQGFPCFPCRADKKPATSRGFKDATCDGNKLKELWERCPNALIGIPTGEVSGLDVLDVDQRNGGDCWFCVHRDRFPSTRVHRTRSGGLHLMFKSEFGFRCSSGKIAPGVDVRANGGYIIWWPAAGFPVLSENSVAQWPDWLSARLLSHRRPVNRRITVPDHYALTRLVSLIASAREGERNDLTYWAACRAGEMVASGLLAADDAAALIAEAATRAGLLPAEAKRTAWSGVRTTGGLARG